MSTEIKSITRRGFLDLPRATKIHSQPLPQLRAQVAGHSRQGRAKFDVFL